MQITVESPNKAFVAIGSGIGPDIFSMVHQASDGDSPTPGTAGDAPALAGNTASMFEFFQVSN